MSSSNSSSNNNNNNTPFTAFDNLQTTGQKHPKTIGVGLFKALVKNNNSRTLQDGDIGWRAPLPNGDRAQMTRHRSGSITETHSTPGDSTKKHSAYHYSATQNVVFKLKARAAKGVRASHESGNNL
jgi:hypothetical protein